MSSKKQEFISTATGGNVGAITRKAIYKCLQSLDGERVIITIDKCSKQRSYEQNRYIHWLFKTFAEALNDLGNEFQMEEVKQLCKLKFLTIEVVNEATGECIGSRIKGTAECTTTELNEFFEKVIIWAKEFFNITLPYPGEIMMLHFDK